MPVDRSAMLIRCVRVDRAERMRARTVLTRFSRSFFLTVQPFAVHSSGPIRSIRRAGVQVQRSDCRGGRLTDKERQRAGWAEWIRSRCFRRPPPPPLLPPRRHPSPARPPRRLSLSRLSAVRPAGAAAARRPSLNGRGASGSICAKSSIRTIISSSAAAACCSWSDRAEEQRGNEQGSGLCSLTLPLLTRVFFSAVGAALFFRASVVSLTRPPPPPSPSSR